MNKNKKKKRKKKKKKKEESEEEERKKQRKLVTFNMPHYLIFYYHNLNIHERLLIMYMYFFFCSISLSFLCCLFVRFLKIICKYERTIYVLIYQTHSSYYWKMYSREQVNNVYIETSNLLNFKRGDIFYMQTMILNYA